MIVCDYCRTPITDSHRCPGCGSPASSSMPDPPKPRPKPQPPKPPVLDDQMVTDITKGLLYALLVFVAFMMILSPLFLLIWGPRLLLF